MLLKVFKAYLKLKPSESIICYFPHVCLRVCFYMKQYTKFNNISGWAVFAIAAWVFLSTIEMTGSFGTVASLLPQPTKLQIGHPPGAPLFLMLSRIMTLLQVAICNPFLSWLMPLAPYECLCCFVYLLDHYCHCKKNCFVKIRSLHFRKDFNRSCKWCCGCYGIYFHRFILVFRC